jgi:hypothetical protein
MTIGKKSKIGFSILAIARPDGLLSCIESIKRYFPNTPIFISVDKYICDDEYVLRKNSETIEVASSLLKQGEIVGFKVSEFNMRTKAAWFWAMRNSFDYFEYSIYFEDDLRLVSDAHLFLEDYLAIAQDGDENLIATLYSSRIHTKFNKICGFSVWPELWGVVLSEKIFLKFDSFCRTKQSERVIENNIYEWGAKHLSFLGKIFQGRFTRFWTWKFQKSLSSDTAWDTQLHYFIWAQDLQVLIPTRELVRDTGLDSTSVSKEKIMKNVRNCCNPLRSLSSRPEQCYICKVRREFLTITA